MPLDSCSQNSTFCFSAAHELNIEAMILASVKHLTLVPALSKLIIAAALRSGHVELQQGTAMSVFVLLL